jgi:hypothetical protein
VQSRRSKQFRELFSKLPKEAKDQAYAAYRLFVNDPRHPSLHFKKLHDRLYSVRVGIMYRALGVMANPDLIIWIWIGPHSEYDGLIKRLISDLK